MLGHRPHSLGGSFCGQRRGSGRAVLCLRRCREWESRLDHER